MTEEGYITKRSIADSVIALCHVKSFEKITIRDISEKCGINGQTFYYHFVDKYDLLEWIYRTDLLDAHMNDVDFDNWPEKLCSTLTGMRADKSFYINTITHTEDYITYYMLEQAQNIFELAIDTLDETRKVDPAQRNFIARFFAYGVCGSILEWAKNGMEDTPENITRRMTTLRDLCEKAAYDYVRDTKSGTE